MHKIDMELREAEMMRGHGMKGSAGRPNHLARLRKVGIEIKEREKKGSFLSLMTRKPLRFERKRREEFEGKRIKWESEEFKWMHALHAIRQAGVIIGPQHCCSATRSLLCRLGLQMKLQWEEFLVSIPVRNPSCMSYYVIFLNFIS